MLHPLPNVQLAVEFVRNRNSPVDDPASGRIRSPSKELTQHVCDTVRYVWRRIPAEDRRIMAADMSNYRNKRLSLWLVKEWSGEISNGKIDYADGVIAIDLSYARLAVKQELAATLAHELGHFRDFAGDPQTALHEGRDLTEEQACYFAETKWRFPHGEVIFKCNACRYIDGVISKRGITGGVFWDADRKSFVYFRDAERLHVGGHDGVKLDTKIGDSLDILLNDTVRQSFRSQKAIVDHLRWVRNRQRQQLSVWKADDVVHPLFIQWKQDIKDRMKQHPRFPSLVMDILPSPQVKELWADGVSVEEMVAWCEMELSAPIVQYA